MARGEHVYVFLRYRSLLPYRHHGIDLGDGTVVHYSSGLASDAGISEAERQRLLEIRRTPMELFCEGRKVHVVKHRNAATPDVICERAASKIGARDYCLIKNNCEHFATWCQTGLSESEQIHSIRESFQTATSGAAKIGMALVVRHSAVSRVVLSRVASTAVQGAVKFHPGYLVGDAVDAVARCTAKRQGMEAEKAHQIGRWAGSSTVAAVGFAIGGPAGAAGAVSLHCVTQKISDKLIGWVESDCLGAAKSTEAVVDSTVKATAVT